ncbi:MAG: hypothetical protein ACKVP0_13030 [Pirellulaceae bacterium]
MNENETLREQMWDLCYGLLSAEEVATLHKQIKSDPAAARLYAEVRLQADLVASAAKVEDASVTLSVPDEGRKVQPAAKKHSGPGESPFKSKSGHLSRKSFRTPSYRAANWLAGLAATALITLIGYGLYAPAKQGSSLSDDQVVATVLGPNSLQSGLTQNLKVVAKTRRGEPASTQLSYQLVSVNGDVTLRDVVQTDKDGEAQLSLPGSAIQPGCRLEVLAQSEKQIEDRVEANEERFHTRRQLGAESRKVVVPLAVREEPVTTDVQLEKDAYQGGETVRFRVHSWRTFSNQPAVAAEEWRLVADDGSEIQPTEIQSRPEAGNVSGTFQLPENAPAGDYRLVGVDRRAGTWQEMEQIVVGTEVSGSNFRRTVMADSNRQLQMLRSMDALAMAKSEDKGITQNDAKKQAEMKEKREMASAGAFPPTPLAGNASTTPVPAEASPEAPLPAPSPKSAASPGGAPFAAAKSEKEKGKDFAKNGVADPSRKGGGPPEESGELAKKSLNEQLAGQDKNYSYSEQRDRAAGVREKETVQMQGDAVTVQIPAELSQKRLLAVISKANSTVVTQQYDGTIPDNSRTAKFDAQDSRSGGVASELAPAKEPGGKLATERSVSPEEQTSPTLLSLHLPPEADGEMDVTLFDQSSQPPKLVFRQSVLRESRRGLNVEVAALQQMGADFAPQEELQLKMSVTDRNGKEVPQSFFAVRIMKLNDANADMDSGIKQRFAAGKVEASASRGRSPAPAALGGGGGFGGGRGSPTKDEMAKEGGKIGDEKKEILEREDLKRDAQKEETKLKKAEESPAKPNGIPSGPSPAAIAGPSGGEKLSGSGPRPAQDDMTQLPGDDRAEVGTLGMSSLAFSDDRLAEQPVVPREVLLGSNESLIQDAVRADEAAAQFATISFRQMVGRAVLLIATGALLLFGILAVMHRPAQAKIWVPAMAVVAGSFVVGSIWLIKGKFAALEIAGMQNEDQRPGRKGFPHAMKLMAPASRASTEPAPTAFDAPATKGVAGYAEITAETTMEKFKENSTGPGIGPTVVVPANSPAPTAQNPSENQAPAPGGPGGRGGGKPDAEQPLGEGKPGEAPTPALKPESSAARPGEPKAGEPKPKESKSGIANRSERAKDMFELKKGDKALDPQKPADLKSDSLTDRDNRAKSPQLLWEPNLPANDKGEAELNLQLPTEPGDYVLIVDVQGPSGIGTVQKRIPVRVPAPAALPAAPSKP